MNFGGFKVVYKLSLSLQKCIGGSKSDYLLFPRLDVNPQYP